MLLSDPLVQKIALVIFVLAIIHTFMVGKFIKLSHRFSHDSMSYRFCHILGEVEAVFGIWALILVFVMAGLHGQADVFNYLESQVQYTEPMLVFVIMTMAATMPVIYFANRSISNIAHLLPMPRRTAFFLSALIIGPLLGSFITEPAAMTVTAMILKNAYYDRGMSKKFMYGTLSVLFVNISIGGTLTHFAAPPVLMVSGAWGWDMTFMMKAFGWKAAIAVVINSALLTWMFRKELAVAPEEKVKREVIRIKPFVVVVQLIFLASVVFFNHNLVIFFGIFIFFLGWCEITQAYQEPLKIKEALLVGFFLAGLVILGKLQAWWLKPLLEDIGSVTLFVGTTALTGITDNAALTYLGTQVDSLSMGLKYSLVAGAVAGGGLTVIANAPNPAGYGILKDSFGEDGISPLGLLKNSLLPTVIAMCCLWFLGSPPAASTGEQAPVVIIDVKTQDKFEINKKPYDFSQLQEHLSEKARKAGGKEKLTLVLMLPEEHHHGGAEDQHHGSELMKSAELDSLIHKLKGIKVRTVKSGQLILTFQAKDDEPEEAGSGLHKDKHEH